MGVGDQFFRGRPVQVRRRDQQRHGEVETVVDPADAGLGGDLRAWPGLPLLARDAFQGVGEAGGTAGGEQLFRVGRGAAGPAEFLRHRELEVDQAVVAANLAVAPAGRRGTRGVEALHRVRLPVCPCPYGRHASRVLANREEDVARPRPGRPPGPRASRRGYRRRNAPSKPERIPPIYFDI